VSGGAGRVGGTVTPLRVPAQVTWERVREIGASFPGWKIYHETRWGTWNAWREGEEPDFRHRASGRRFMVSTYDPDGLVDLLERQVGIDIGLEFPGCHVQRADSGGWYAVYRDQADNGRDATVWLVHAPAIADLDAGLRALSDEAACQRRRP
jgi:hypothetical protein